MMGFQKWLNLFFIYTLLLVLIGAYLYQYIARQEPCPLCLLQRLGMIGVACSLLMNLRFGIKAQHYGLAILSAMIGRSFSLKQISLHICPGFPSYDQEVFGLDLYMWAFIVFSCSIFASAVLCIFYGYSEPAKKSAVFGVLDHLAFWGVFTLTAGNILTMLI